MKYENIPQIKEYIDGLKIDKSIHTIRTYTTAINMLLDFIKVNNFSEFSKITSQDLRKFQIYLKENGSCHSTINSRLRPIKAMFNWMIENEYMESSPSKNVKNLKPPKIEPPFLSEEEVSEMIGACRNDKDKLIIALLVETGIRRNELVTLKLSDYDGQHITVHGKGNKERTLILKDDVIELLDKWIEKRNKKYGNDIEYIFISNLGCQYNGGSILDKVKNIMHRANFTEDRISQIHTHSLRHTFTANLFESGADIFVAQRALGHENLATTQRYAHLRNSALDRAMTNMKSVLKG